MAELPSGFFLVDKPSGPTSYDMIRWIKGALKGAKIGHSGTLDPMASGLLIMLVGRSATKQQDWFMQQEKTYLARLRFGVRTNTGDTTGHEVAKAPVPVRTPEEFGKILESFVGPHMQTPPMYSALKHEGTPLYKLARRGEEVVRPPRPITLHSMELVSVPAPDELEFRVRCSSGTYVRTLAEDIGTRCGSEAAMCALRREAIGPFSVDTATPGDQLKTLSTDGLAALILPLDPQAE